MYNSPMPSSVYGLNNDLGDFSAVTNTVLSEGTTALDVNWVQSGPITISANTSANSEQNPIYTTSTLTIPESGIEVTINQPSSGLLVTINAPTSGIPVTVLSSEDYKPRINDYQNTTITKNTSGTLTHTISVSSNIGTWTVGSDGDATFTMKIGGNVKMIARTSAAQRQVQIMFPTALMTAGNITIEVINEDLGDSSSVFSVINGFQE